MNKDKKKTEEHSFIETSGIKFLFAVNLLILGPFSTSVTTFFSTAERR